MQVDKLTGESEAAPETPVRRGRRAVRVPAGRARQPLPEPPGSRPDGEERLKRGEAVRQKLRQAALECFGAFGFEGTSTRAIADRAGVTHSLLLYHFTSKEQLWISTMEESIGNYAQSVYAIFDQDPDGPAAPKLRAFIERFVRFSARYPQIHRIMTSESTQNSERLAVLVDRHIRKHYETVRAVIQRGQMEGSVHDGDAARLYYNIIGASGTPFTVPAEYRMLTGRDVFSEAEIHHTIAFIFELVFT